MGRYEMLVEPAERDLRHFVFWVRLERDGAVGQRILHVCGDGFHAARRRLQHGGAAEGDDSFEPARQWVAYSGSRLATTVCNIVLGKRQAQRLAIQLVGRGARNQPPTSTCLSNRAN